MAAPPASVGALGANRSKPGPEVQLLGADDQAALDSVRDSLHVSREGFEFHICYRTRFGQNKTEKLDEGLESLQRMRVLQPHLTLQKSGIRLVITRWDGENYVEEQGIENLEHAAPEDIETLIRNHLFGASSADGGTGHVATAKPRVSRIELVRKAHDPRFHLVLHREDRSREESVVLVRSNMAQLMHARVFPPDIVLSMTALNDTVVIENEAAPVGPARVQRLPLRNDDDARKVEVALNACLIVHKESAPHTEGVATVCAAPSVEVIPPAILSPAVAAPHIVTTPGLVAAPPVAAPPIAAPPVAAPPVAAPPFVHESSRAAAKAPRAESAPATAPAPGSPPQVTLAAAPPAKPVAPRQADWRTDVLNAVAHLPLETTSAEIFSRLRAHFGCEESLDEHGFRFFRFPGPAGACFEQMQVVLAPHYLLVAVPFGYLRFGSEARVYLDALDDYLAFNRQALRGLALRPGGDAPVWVVSTEFWHFVQSASQRAYYTAFKELLVAPADLPVNDELVWPLSREGQLFEALVETAKGYELPVTADTIVLDPHAQEFIGFKKVASGGLEFRDGDEFVRFTPTAFEWGVGAATREWAMSNVLSGWALDNESCVCAIYGNRSFVPPPEIQLVRFISEEEMKASAGSLTVLATLAAV